MGPAGVTVWSSPGRPARIPQRPGSYRYRTSRARRPWPLGGRTEAAGRPL